MAEDRDFLSRWSRLKAEARRDTTREEEPAAVAAPAPSSAEKVEANNDTDTDSEPNDLDIPEELRNIDIDALDYDADFTVFLKAGVPEVMRKKALRRLWRSNPVLACLDGLNDYEEDFTDAATAVTGLESAYRIGKGYFFAEDEDREAATVEPGSEVSASDQPDHDEIEPETNDGDEQEGTVEAWESGDKTADSSGRA